MLFPCLAGIKMHCSNLFVKKMCRKTCGVCQGNCSTKGCSASVVSYLSNRPQVSVVYKLINQRNVGRTREEFVNYEPQASGLRILRVFYQHPKWFISLQTTENCGLLLLYNNSEDARFFRGFTGTITHS